MPVLSSHGEMYHVLHLGTSQSVSVGSTATTFGSAVQAQLLRITADIGINYLLGASPTAATTDVRLPSDVVEYIQCSIGNVVSVRTTTGTATGVLGTVWITEGS